MFLLLVEETNERCVQSRFVLLYSTQANFSFGSGHRLEFGLGPGSDWGFLEIVNSQTFSGSEPWNNLKVTYFDEDYTEQHHSYMHPFGSAYVYKYLEKVWNVSSDASKLFR